MKSTLGQPRVLTDAQVAEVLAWHTRVRAWQERRAAVQSKRALAAELGVKPATVDRAIARGPEYRAPPVWDRPRGRPPTLHDPQVLARIHAWHAEELALQALRDQIGTLEQIARRLGASSKAVATAIARGGLYKQPSPEQRRAELARRYAHIAKLRKLALY